MTDESTWPDGTVQTVWEGPDGLMAESCIRSLVLNDARTETARLVTRTTTTTVTPTTYVGNAADANPLHDPPVFDLSPLTDDDPTVVVACNPYREFGAAR